jgi:dephospho-CoA kinase
MTRPVIGVTGLPCSGKSLAARFIASGSVTGIPGELFKADDAGHEILTRPEVAARLRERLGDDIVASADPAAIRRAIAARVFADAPALAWLEGVVHPLVRAEVDRLAAGDETRPLVMEAALLFGSAMEERCDRILLIEADFAVRLRRAAARGWNRAELERRERRLLPLFAREGKGAQRDRIARVANNDDAEALRCRLHDVLSAFSE